MKTNLLLSAVGTSCLLLSSAFAFEGHITAKITRGAAVSGLLYTVGTNHLRIEPTQTERPHARDIVNRQTGEWTLLFPQNGTFMRMRSEAMTSSRPPPARGPGTALGANPVTAMPPPGTGLPGMARPPMEKIVLTATGETTNLLGLACARYEIKRRGQTMEIWATDQVLGFQPYRESQPNRFGPQRIEEQWGDLLKAKNLFPLLAVLKFDNGAERWRFEVKSITPEKVADDSAELFQPPPGYIEIQPLPF